MQSVLIVCGAGASSTFLASRLRTLAKSRGIDLTATPVSVGDVGSRLGTSTLLLVGPHLADAFETLSAEAAIHGVRAGLLPPDAFSPQGAERALELVTSLSGSDPAELPSIDATK